MTENKMLKNIYDETMSFFENIFTSHELQLEYDLVDYANRDFVFKTIKDFKESPTACIIKPFYEKDYNASTIPRSITIKRNEYGFITCTSSLAPNEPSVIEPFRFVSIVKQLIEDENIKKEMYSEKENSKDTDFSL